MVCKVGQIISRGDRRWLTRTCVDRDHETQETQLPQPNDPRSMWEAQAYLSAREICAAGRRQTAASLSLSISAARRSRTSGALQQALCDA
jgi:hypothetical protein